MAGLKAWRLSKRRYASDAFSGEGPKLYGGRWSPVGVPVVYCSLSLSLAVLEVFVHMTSRPGLDDYVYVSAELSIEESQTERAEVASLPPDWKQIENPLLKEIGREWAQSQRSLALLVPSVIIPGEWNAVINPLHPSAKDIVVHDPGPFYFDERMFAVR